MCVESGAPSIRSVRERKQYVHVLTAIAGILLLMALLWVPAGAQTSSSAVVLGTVTDSTGAVVSGADVTLVNVATNATTKQTTNASGQYTFPNLPPDDYQLTVKARGFKTTTIPAFTANVNKSYTVNASLQVGGESQVVEVSAGSLELQTTDSQVGNVLEERSIERLPTLRRSASELLNLQPGVSPAGSNSAQVRVTGAIDDQNTVTLDGIDISDNLVGGGNTARTVIPVPVDSVEEFRVGVSNPNATFARSSGAQVALIGRRGTNTLHGAGYWYHQNDELNANSWENNRLHIPRAEMKDNRFGGRLGGPILKDKTFFFVNYEGRRFPQSFNVLRLVPSDTLKQGIVRFRDSSNNIVSYNLANAAFCGVDSSGNRLNLACDPRGIGISPLIQQYWSLMPAGNDPSAPGADGLNTVGFRSTISSPLTDDYSVLRLDHAITQNWKFNGSYTYYRDLIQGNGLATAQLDIRGATAKPVVRTSTRGDAITGSLTGQLTSNLMNVFRFGWVRDRQVSAALPPSDSAALLALPGTIGSAGPVALAPGLAQTGLIDSPIDVDTQRARYQASFGKDIQWVDDMTWMKGNHSLQFGTSVNRLPLVHIRADKVIGSLTSLVATEDADVSNFLQIPAANRPPACSASITTNCLSSNDSLRWDRLYAATLGLVDNVGILAVRDGNLNPLPFGTLLANDTHQWAYQFYGQDTWRIRSNLTLNYGLAYGWQSPPSEKLGRQTLIVDAASKQPLTADGYLNSKLQAAMQGQAFDPQIGYLPVGSAHRSVYDTDWRDLSPRVAFAYTPGFTHGLLGKLTGGSNKMVVRGGFGIIYDRSNTVQSVLIPMLGVGFAQTITVATPACNTSSAPGANCNPSGGNPGLSLYRVGVDGSIPLPTVPAVSNPVIPAVPFGETLSFQDDPHFKVGRSYNVDFSIQRELAGGVMLEATYSGRFARDLPMAVNFNQSPYMLVDKASGQTFAQAFDTVATALRTGQPVTPQPWFENQLAGAAPAGQVTALLASNSRSAFVNGLVSSLFNSGKFAINTLRQSLGLTPYNSRQALELFMRTFGGESNYNGLLLSVRKRTSRGLAFDANYTYSRALDNGVLNQNQAAFYSNSFFTHADYGPSAFDRTHVFNGNFVYDLPAGKGHRFSTGNWLDKVIGGWYTSGIFTAFSGLPLIVTESNQVWGGGQIFGASVGAIPTASVSTGLNSGVTSSTPVASSGNISSKGTGLNLFSDPNAAFNAFRKVLLSQDTQTGRDNPLRGLGFWNFDMSVGKNTAVTERVNFRYSVDFFNLFNHVNFADPTGGQSGGLSLQNQASFGVISSQFVPANRSSGARWIEFGLRLEF